jgi:hypothetical protein
MMMARSSVMQAMPEENVAPRDVVRLLGANDPLLASLILAETDGERSEALERLIVDHARPVIDLVLLRHSDAAFVGEEPEDIASTVIVRLVWRLQAAAIDDGKAVASLADFTATLTFNAVYDVVRRRFPARTRLKNRVRYVITHDARFRPEGAACALAQWSASARVERPATGIVDAGFSQKRLGDAIDAILSATKAPVLVDDVVRELAKAWGIEDAMPVNSNAIDACGVADESLAVRIESRQYLTALWREIADLRAPQRAALLLNLRDADQRNALALFVRVGVATMDAIAAAAGLAVDQLAAVWNDLPLDDLRIAARLGVTRQQVINLRKSARARLARRMGRL